jgi:hypothetical protein
LDRGGRAEELKPACASRARHQALGYLDGIVWRPTTLTEGSTCSGAVAPNDVGVMIFDYATSAYATSQLQTFLSQQPGNFTAGILLQQ